mgnify:CR=1 FL=1
MLERDIVRSIRSYLNAIDGVFVWKTHGGQFGTAGEPDLIGSYKGKALGIEVKRPGKKATRLQDLFLKKLQAAGATAFVACSIEDVKQKLNIK